MLAICIPTNNDDIENIRIGYTLLSLKMQNYLDYKVYIRDEGKIEIFADRNTRLVSNLLSQSGIEIEYHRKNTKSGVGYARKELIDWLRNEDYILFLDDDMIVMPNAIEVLVTEIERSRKIGFVQGRDCRNSHNKRLN